MQPKTATAVQLLSVGIMVACLAAVGFGPSRLRTAAAADAFEQPPISYSLSEPHNALATLNVRLASGDEALQFDESTGYLKSLLSVLRIPVSSQALVFSKTSLQQRLISPRNRQVTGCLQLRATRSCISPSLIGIIFARFCWRHALMRPRT